MNHKKIHQDLFRSLSAQSIPEKKLWFEKYLRYAVKYRGVVTPRIKDILVSWRERHGLSSLKAAQQLRLVSELWRSKYAEDKFAATLYIQLFLLRALPQDDILDQAEQAFAERLFYDWSTVDWLCMRVLAPLARRSQAAGHRILDWKEADYLWQARASLVPFASLPFMPQYREAALQACDLLIRREERFAKTAVGWFLRVLSRSDPDLVQEKLTAYRDHVTPEVVRNATKYST